VHAGAVRPWSRPLDWPARELALPLFIAAWTQIDVWGSPPFAFGNMVGPRWVVSLLYAVTSLALIWRKQSPLGVLAFVVAADSAVYVAFGAPEALGSFLPLLLALYSVGRYASPATGALAVPLAALAIAVHDLTDPAFSFSGSTSFFWLVLAAAWPLGYAFHRRDLEHEALASEGADRARAAVEAERSRIARELHDVVGHGLSVVVLQLVGAVGLLDKGDTAAARSRLLTTERSARDALAEMRRLLGLLDDGGETSLTSQPGLAQLDRLVAETRSAGADIDVTVTGAPVELPPGVDLAAFRILQESLTNVLRHSRPARAHVHLGYEPDAVVVEVRDEGRSRGEPGRDGRGLTGMRERVAVYGGELEVGPRSPHGHLVRARLPVVS
jgi:signal transduction histidine kinase